MPSAQQWRAAALTLRDHAAEFEAIAEKMEQTGPEDPVRAALRRLVFLKQLKDRDPVSYANLTPGTKEGAWADAREALGVAGE